MLLCMAIVAVLVPAETPPREPVPGGVYEKRECARLHHLITAEFEDFPEDELKARPSVDFECAMALFLDPPDMTPKQKFDYLLVQARRSEKRGVALARYMVALDRKRYYEYIYERASKFGPEQWEAAVDAAGCSSDPNGERPQCPPRLLRLFFAQALHSESLTVRHKMLFSFENPNLSAEEALAFAKRLDVEEGPFIRTDILLTETHRNDSVANGVIREFLRGPLDFKALEKLCNYHGQFGSGLVLRNRYDFLPDLKALRARLAAEKDVRRKHEAKEAIAILDPTIEKLEELKEAGAPICPPSKKKENKEDKGKKE